LPTNAPEFAHSAAFPPLKGLEWETWNKHALQLQTEHSEVFIMLTDYSVLLLSAILVNNFVLVQFLGLCPFMGVSNKLESAMGMAMATTFVLTLASACSNLVYHFLLVPLGLTYLKTITFILVIAVVVQFTEMVVKKTSPLLYRVLGVYRQLCSAWPRALEHQQGSQFPAVAGLWRWRRGGLFARAGVVCRHA
jgi:hypothetical protein